MMDENFKFIDESGDKKYFAITPYVIINGYSARDSGIYTYIKRRCGEDKNGIWRESKKRAAKRMGVSHPTLYRTIKKFEQDGRIECIGIENKGLAHNKIYRILDIWRENVLQYSREKQVKRRYSPQGIAGKREIPGAGKREIPKEKTTEEKNVSVRANTRKINIIKLFASLKGLDEKAKEFGSFLRRNLRPAQNLLDYSDDRIEEVMVWLNKNADFKWGLESVGKYIDEDLSGLEGKQRRFNGEFKCDFGHWHPRGEHCGHTIITEHKK